MAQENLPIHLCQNSDQFFGINHYSSVQCWGARTTLLHSGLPPMGILTRHHRVLRRLTRFKYPTALLVMMIRYYYHLLLIRNCKQLLQLFKLRSKTLDVKLNFKSAHQNPWCLSCGLFPESQDHILQCPELNQKLSYIKGKTSKLSGNDVYKNLDKQLVITNIYSDLLDIREVAYRNELQ